MPQRIRSEGWLYLALMCAFLLFAHRASLYRSAWVSFLSACGLIIAVSLYAGALAGAHGLPRSQRTAVVFKRLFTAWLFVFPILLFVQQYLKYRAYASEAWDLGVISHALSATLRGHFFQNIFTGSGVPMSAFSQHTELVFVALYPLFACVPHPLTLVAVQSIALAAAVVVFYRLANMLLNDQVSAVVCAASFSIYPAFYYCGILDVHADALALPFILLMLVSTLKQQGARTVLFLVIALACKEYTALIGFLWGLYCAITLKKTRLGVVVCLLSCGWLAVALYTQWLLRPSDVPSLFNVFYCSQLSHGGSAAILPWLHSTAARVLRPENAQNMLFLFVPVLFYCFRYPWIVVFLSLPLLKDLPVGLSIESHRMAPALPLLWYCVLRGLPKRTNDGRKRATAIIAVSVAAALSSALFSEAPWSQRFLRNWSMKYHCPARAAALDSIVTALPAENPASASPTLYPHLIDRWRLYLFPVLGKSVPATYAALEKARLSTEERRVVDSLITKGAWRVRRENSYGLLLERRAEPTNLR